MNGLSKKSKKYPQRTATGVVRIYGSVQWGHILVRSFTCVDTRVCNSFFVVRAEREDISVS